ncbi:MAG: VOC family protein [Polyangiaceae bacterium]
MSTLAVHHLAVVVADLERSERFYCDVLGLEVIRRWDDDHGQPRSIWVQLAHGAFLAIEKAATTSPTRTDTAPGHHCVALAITRADRDSWKARLNHAGITMERESAYSIYVRDPDGCLIALSHFPEPT